MTKQSILAFLLLLLVACHNARQVPGTAPVYYSDERSVSLLPTASMTEKLDMPQHIVGEFHKPDGSIDSFEAGQMIPFFRWCYFLDSGRLSAKSATSAIP